MKYLAYTAAIGTVVALCLPVHAQNQPVAGREKLLGRVVLRWAK